MIPIGQFARLTRLSVKQLRSYDALGLLAPARVDERSGYRSYHPAQARTAITIALLRSLDVPLETVRELLVVDDAEATALIAAHRARLAAELARTERTMRALSHLRGDLELMPHPVRTGVDPPRRLLALHGTSTVEALSGDAATLIARLSRHPVAAGVAGDPAVVGLYPLDLEGAVAFTVGVEVEVAVGVEVEVDRGTGDDRPGPAPEGGTPRPGERPDRTSPAAAVAASDVPPDPVPVDLPGGPVARVVHVGPHDELPLAWFPLLAWARERGHEVAGAVRERYLDDPATTDPHHLRTEITIPLDTTGDPA